jgi:hypothetical protein
VLETGSTPSPESLRHSTATSLSPYATTSLSTSPTRSWSPEDSMRAAWFLRDHPSTTAHQPSSRLLGNDRLAQYGGRESLR